MRASLRIGCAGMVAVLAGTPAADVVTLSASKDNTLYSESGQLSNGAGDHVFAGATDNADLRRAVIAFDVASMIPAGSVIQAVSLKLRMSRTKAGTENVGLHLALSDWGEGASDAPDNEGTGTQAETGDATWEFTFYPGSSWSASGGDFAGPTASATTAVGGNGDYFWSGAGLVADVQAWLDNPSTNYGWFVRGNEAGTKTAKRFDSRTNGTVSRRPELTVTFQPPASTGACCLPDGSCLVLSPTDCGNMGGTYQGNGEVCTPNPCPQPTAACCFSDGTCMELTLADCNAQGGTWQGVGSDCTPNPCPQPTGACCFPDGTCSELTLADCTTQSGAWQGPGTVCTPNPCPVLLTPFVDPLPIPVAATPVSGTAGFEAEYVITAVELQQQLHRDLPPTTVWAYDGTYPGPTIEARKDERVTVHWENDLRDPMGNLRTSHYLPVDLCPHGPNTEGDTPRTVVHLHGAHVQARYDGYPEDTILPGESQTYIYENHQLPATLWYHDHALGITRLNVYMGLAGAYLIRDAFEESLGLPAGEFEIPIVMQDRSFNPDGSWKYPAAWQDHFFGDSMLVNGKVWPFLDVKQGKYRFRLMNGCNSRVLTLALSNAATFEVIGTEGGLLPAPVTVSQLTLGTGERYDVVMDFASYPAGTEIELVNSAPTPFPGTPGVGVIPDVLRFVVSSDPGHVAALPTTLRPLKVLDESTADVFRSFELRKVSDPCTGEVWLINGLKWDDITERPYLNDTEVWSFANRSGVTHPMHMHLVLFQVLDRQPFTIVGGVPVASGPPVLPPAHEVGWKDTVQTYPNEFTRVIARFTDYTGKYPYHCHILEHEDHEMMRQFEVIKRPYRLAPSPVLRPGGP